MSATLPTIDASLSPSMIIRVEKVCDRFEAAVRAGLRPRIEDYLGEVDEAGRPALLRALLALDLLLRQGRGERPTRDDYTRRFPGQAAVVDAAFQSWIAEAQKTALPQETLLQPTPAPGPEAAAGDPEPPSAIPKTIGKYVVVGPLGGGAGPGLPRPASPASQRICAQALPAADEPRPGRPRSPGG